MKYLSLVFVLLAGPALANDLKPINVEALLLHSELEVRVAHHKMLLKQFLEAESMAEVTDRKTEGYHEKLARLQGSLADSKKRISKLGEEYNRRVKAVNHESARAEEQQDVEKVARAALVQQQAALKIKLAALEQTHGAKHPERLSLVRQLEVIGEHLAAMKK